MGRPSDEGTLRGLPPGAAGAGGGMREGKAAVSEVRGSRVLAGSSGGVDGGGAGVLLDPVASCPGEVVTVSLKGRTCRLQYSWVSPW